MSDERLNEAFRIIERMQESIHALETRFAVSENNRAHMDERFDKIDRRLDGYSNWMKWLVFIIAGGVAARIVEFAMAGGFVFP